MRLATAKSREPRQIVAELQRHFVETPAPCPYGLPYPAVYHQARFANMPEPLMGLLLAAGCRRNGNCFYSMHCRECSACVPIRLEPEGFRPNRNQRRVLKANTDLFIDSGPIAMSAESLELMDKFLAARYPGRGSKAADYYHGFFSNVFGCSFELRYRLAGRLVGVAIVDGGSNWWSAVYFFFDPEFTRRSLGTFNILTLVDLGRRQGIDYLYLGYWIEKVGAMKYKAAFHPHYLFLNGEWTRAAKAAG